MPDALSQQIIDDPRAWEVVAAFAPVGLFPEYTSAERSTVLAALWELAEFRAALAERCPAG